MRENIGLWLVGGGGSVASTVALGWAAIQRQLIDSAGLVSDLPIFENSGLLLLKDLVLGGHEIRKTDLYKTAHDFAAASRSFPADWVDDCKPDLDQISSRLRFGILKNPGNAIRALAGPDFPASHRDQPAAQLVELVRSDLRQFQAANNLARTVVVNLASTEPEIDNLSLPTTWDGLQPMLNSEDCPLGSSSIYAVAAFLEGAAFVNFTPSLGSNCAALKELALSQSVCHCGQDGKTGETLVKSSLAPLFAYRNLPVLSWVGHNIFGNTDAQVLDDPHNKQTKVRSKDGLLHSILGYSPQSHISIENIASLGEWKTAWDHIHFRGFLGTPMVMQFIWQGCDSILAAPLVLDLCRFTERALRDQQSGVLEQLACFFKSPMAREPSTTIDNDFSRQFTDLTRWATSLQTQSVR